MRVARIAGRQPHSAAIAPYITSVILHENADEQERARLVSMPPPRWPIYIGKMGVYYAADAHPSWLW